MSADRDPLTLEPAILRLLGPDEEVRHVTTAGDTLLAVTSHRIAVVDGERTALDLAIEGLRRIQFDIEKTRPASLVLVPEKAEYPPQVLAVQPDEYRAVADALVTIGIRLAESSNGG
jgi:hypothetical protein